MATYIKTLKEDNGDITYPQTKAGAVLLDNGSDLETVLAAKADASTVNQKITVGDVQSTDIVANAVTTAKITDGAVTSAKLAKGAVTSAKINWTTLSHVSSVGTSTVVDVRQVVTTLCEVTIPEDGVYFASAVADPNLLGTDVGDSTVYLALNNKNIAGAQVFFNNSSKQWFLGGCTVSAIVSCKKGDKIQLRGKCGKNHFEVGERRRLDAFRIG